MALTESIAINPLQAVIEQLPKCNPSDIGKIKALIDVMGFSKPNQQTITHEEIVYGAVADQLTGIGLTISPLYALRKSSEKKRFIEAVSLLDAWSNRHFKGLSRVEQDRLYQLCFKLVISMINRSDKIPCNLRMVLACTKRIPELFEEAFPGYIGAGMAKAVIAGKIKNAVRARN